MIVDDLRYMFDSSIEFTGDAVDYWDYTLYLQPHGKEEAKYELSRSDIEDMIDGAKQLIKTLEQALPEGY